jgi:cytochrome c biogenesis protein
VSPNKSDKATSTGFTDKIWKFFTSLKLVIPLLLILAALSIAGTIIEQNKPLQEYYRYYKPSTVALFNSLGLLDMYHSWWFVTCLGLLALNIIACTMDRYAPIMSGLRKKNLILDENLEKTLNPKDKIKYALALDDVEKKVLELAGKGFGGKPVMTALDDGSRHYFFEKGKFSRLAFFFTHLSVLLIFIGALVGSFFGYKGYANIYEGETLTRVETRTGQVKTLDFSVKCNAFTADFYPNGMPKDYISDLTVIKDGKEVLRKNIKVNDPLSFQGITFYQSSYGSLPQGAQLEVRNQDGSLRSVVEAPLHQRADVPGGKEQVEVADYQEHFHLPDGSEGGAAVGVNIYPENGEPFGIWLLAADPDYDKARRGPYYLLVKELKLKKYTGLQINKDPGEWFVWVGSLLMIGGIMVAFFMSHKKLWVCLRKDKKGRTELTIGGAVNKNRAVFVREVEGIIQGLKEVA